MYAGAFRAFGLGHDTTRVSGHVTQTDNRTMNPPPPDGSPCDPGTIDKSGCGTRGYDHAMFTLDNAVSPSPSCVGANGAPRDADIAAGGRVFGYRSIHAREHTAVTRTILGPSIGPHGDGSVVQWGQLSWIHHNHLDGE